MGINDQFLKDFMQGVDLNCFTPGLYRYFQDFLEIEKVRKYNSQFVISTFIPPFPGKAFDRFMTTFFSSNGSSLIQSVDLAVTNACIYRCPHCYNGGRMLADPSTETLKKVVEQLQDIGAIVINFTGGEPCLRRDLVDVCSGLREDTCGIIATTGYGFTDELAEALKETRVYSIAVSLDSADEETHDRGRGVRGAYKIAFSAIERAKKHGFYTYTCAVPTKTLLKPENFDALYQLNLSLGVDELQLLEPAPAGRYLKTDIDFGKAEFATVWAYMAEYNARPDGLAVTSFAHMESPDFFGCGAGHSHIYVDGTGEVSPCNMLPVSYGNVSKDDLTVIVERMQQAISQPCQTCLAHMLKDFFREHGKGKRPASWDAIPPIPVPDEPLPRFFQILGNQDREISGTSEIVSGYSDASVSYDDYWLTVASTPIDKMFRLLELPASGFGLDCGCGTGYTTARLAGKLGREGRVLGIDLTLAMIEKAKERMQRDGLTNVEFRVGDVLEELQQIPPASIDVVLSTWLIGYVGCNELFPLVKRVLKPGGLFGFVAHLDRSPLVPIEVFEEITREEPDCLNKAARMKFPHNDIEVRHHLIKTGLSAQHVIEGKFYYSGKSGRDVYDHVMKSGAGTTFYYSLRPNCRERLAEEFIARIDQRFASQSEICIEHRYAVGIARS